MKICPLNSGYCTGFSNNQKKHSSSFGMAALTLPVEEDIKKGIASAIEGDKRELLDYMADDLRYIAQNEKDYIIFSDAKTSAKNEQPKEANYFIRPKGFWGRLVGPKFHLTTIYPSISDYEGLAAALRNGMLRFHAKKVFAQLEKGENNDSK